GDHLLSCMLIYSLAAEQPEPDGKGARLSPSIRKELRRPRDVIDYIGVAAVSEIVETETPGPKVMQRPKRESPYGPAASALREGTRRSAYSDNRGRRDLRRGAAT